MNKVILVGRLTRDPEVRYSQGDHATAVARYTVAVDRRFKRDGEPTADFIPCVVFGRSAEFAEKYFRQGMNKQCGLLVNSSRGIIYADKSENFGIAARAESKKIQEQMEALLQERSLI